MAKIECEGQLSIFDWIQREIPYYKNHKKVRLIELFAGVGSQAMALRDIGADFEHYRVVEFDKYAIASYNAIHGTEFPTMDVTKIKGEGLGIVEKEKYTYLLTYLLLPLYRFVGSRKDAWNGRRKWNTFKPIVGSKKAT